MLTPRIHFVPPYYDFSYKQHPAVTSRFFFSKKNKLIINFNVQKSLYTTSTGYNGTQCRWGNLYRTNFLRLHLYHHLMQCKTFTVTQTQTLILTPRVCEPLRSLLKYHWWLVESHLGGCFCLLLQNFGRWWGPTNDIMSVWECSLGS